jgi:hypothetical protein
MSHPFIPMLFCKGYMGTNIFLLSTHSTNLRVLFEAILGYTSEVTF